MSKTTWIAVKTNKREYWIKAGSENKVLWLPGEKIVSIEPASEEDSCSS